MFSNINVLADLTVIIAGWFVSYFFRHMIFGRIENSVVRVRRLLLRFRKLENRFLDIPASIQCNVRHVDNVNAIGAVMLRQYSENAQRVIIYVGDCNFLEEDGNSNLLNHLLALSDTAGTLKIVSSHDLNKFREKYDLPGPGNRRSREIYQLLKKLDETGHFLHNRDLRFRGSFVDYGSSYAVFTYHADNENAGDIYPGTVVSLTSERTISFGDRQVAIRSMLQVLEELQPSRVG